MVCTKMTMLYEKYKTEWMTEHGITIDELMRELDDFRIDHEQDGEDFDSISQLMGIWEIEGNGFCGEIWACYDEWEENEFYEELCDRIRDKARILQDKEGTLIFFTPFKEIALSLNDFDDWGEVAAEFILYGDYAVNERDAKDERLRSSIIDWLWLNDEKGGTY